MYKSKSSYELAPHICTWMYAVTWPSPLAYVDLFHQRRDRHERYWVIRQVVDEIVNLITQDTKPRMYTETELNGMLSTSQIAHRTKSSPESLRHMLRAFFQACRWTKAFKTPCQIDQRFPHTLESVDIVSIRVQIPKKPTPATNPT